MTATDVGPTQDGCTDPHLRAIRLSATEQSEWTVLAVAGELDIAQASVLGDRIASVLDSGTDCLALDLSQVTFMDCGGLSALVAGRRHAARRGAHLRLIAPHPVVQRLLRLTGTAGLWDLHQGIGLRDAHRRTPTPSALVG